MILDIEYKQKLINIEFIKIYFSNYKHFNFIEYDK